jgi:hypothetical protein
MTTIALGKKLHFIARKPVIFACPIEHKKKKVGIAGDWKFNFGHHQTRALQLMFFVLKETILGIFKQLNLFFSYFHFDQLLRLQERGSDRP